jgi:hypothetical protein
MKRSEAAAATHAKKSGRKPSVGDPWNLHGSARVVDETSFAACFVDADPGFSLFHWVGSKQ